MEHNFKDFHAGDLYNFYLTNSNYNEDYTCKVIFIKTNHKYEVELVYTNQRFEGALLPEESTLYSDGLYKVFALFQKDGFQKTEEIGKVNVLKNILDSTGMEIESYNRKMLTAIENMLMGRTLTDYDSYTIGNRSITKMSPDSLLKMRAFFQEKVNDEEAWANGTNKGNKIIVEWHGRYNG